MNASASASVASLKVASEATVSGMLVAYSAETQDHFKSLGQTTLGKTLIAGDLIIDGTMSVTGNSINTIGVLSLQNSSLAQGVDIFNGKVTINNLGQITAIAVSTNKLILGSQVLGESKITTGTQETTVQTLAITEKSRIFITAQTEIDTPLFVAGKIVGQSFTVRTKNPPKDDIIFDWQVLDNP